MLKNVQVLRGIAALLVVWVHAQEYISTSLIPTALRQAGYGGVDLFFVVSGFIIVHSTSKGMDCVTFIKRRILRVAPLYYFFTGVVVLLCLFAPSIFKSTQIDFASIVKSLCFIPFEKALGHVYPIYSLGWTLNYEMFFYAVFAPMLMISNPRTRVFLCGTLLVVLSIVGSRVRSPNDWGVIPYAFTRPILLDFVLGMTIAGCSQMLPKKVAAPYYPLLVLGFSGLALSNVVLADRMLEVFPDTSTVMRFGLPSALIVTAAVGLEACNRKIGNKFLELTGDASYSIYLSHFFVVTFVGLTLSRLLQNNVASLLGACLSMSAAPLIGLLTYRYLERPLSGDLTYIIGRKSFVTSKPSA